MSDRPFPALAALLIATLAACATPPARVDSRFSAAEPAHLLGPGDRIEVIVHTAPELSRELVVGPDGIVSMPLAGPVMAMARTPEELAASLRAALATELINPELEVMATGYASPKVFVGGEVSAPGLIDLSGQITPLEAIARAGGVTPGGHADEALLIRRQPGGDLLAGRIGPTSGDLHLKRFDVLYIPASPIAEPGPFAEQYIRDALPLPFQLFYGASGH